MKLSSVIFFIASLASGVYASDSLRSRQNHDHIDEDKDANSPVEDVVGR